MVRKDWACQTSPGVSIHKMEAYIGTRDDDVAQVLEEINGDGARYKGIFRNLRTWEASAQRKRGMTRKQDKYHQRVCSI